MPSQQIAGIETVHLIHPYAKPFVYGGGTCTGRLTSLVRVHTEDGICGIGSVYSHPALVEIVVKQQLEPLLIGCDPADVESIWQLMYGVTRWYGRKGAAVSALGAIDMALWDLRGKAAGKPLRKLISLDARDQCPAYASALLWQDIPSLVDEAAKHIEQGYRRMKMRIARSREYDVAAVQAVRKAIGPRNDLMVDAVMRYDLQTATEMMKIFDDNRIFWLEEPFPPEDPVRYRALKPRCTVPLACGENEFGFDGFAPWIESKAVDIVQPDASRCGGISVAVRVARMARDAGLRIAPHTWNDAVAVIANAQVVAAMSNGITVEIDRTGNAFIDELLVEPIQVRDGMLKLSDAPGLGIELRSDALARYRLKDPLHIPDGNYSDFAFGPGNFKPAGAQATEGSAA